MITMMSLATTTNPNITHTNMSMSTSASTGAYARPRVLGFSRDVGVDVNTRHVEAAAAAVRRASGAQVRVNNIKYNDKK